MKRLIIIIFLAFSISAIAQRSKVVKNNPNYDRKPIHFGFSIGVNTLNFNLHRSELLNSSNHIFSIESVSGMGFHLGPISNFRLGEYFDARCLIDLTFGERSIEYMIKDTLPGVTALKKQTLSVESIFIEMPMMLKYKAVRQDNYRPYVIAGINPKLDLAARKELKPEELTKKLKLNPFDVYYEVGFGIDYYLPYFKFSTEFKYSFGVLNVLANDGTEFTSTIDKLTSNMFVVSLHFE